MLYISRNSRLYTSLPGIVDNGIYCIRLCENAQLRTDIILNKLNLFLVDLYIHFLRCVNKRPELIELYWKSLRKFYLQVYQKYEDAENNESQMTVNFSKYLKTARKFIPNPNIKRFIADLKNNEEMPLYFYNYYEFK